jgi:hypothetical protein
MVMLNGVFPDYMNATIAFDGVGATVFHATPQSLWIITPAHAEGLVDITLTAPNATLTMNNAFRYLSTTGSSAGSGGGPSGGNGNGSSGNGSNGGSNGGSSNITTTTVANGSTATTIGPPRYRGTLKLVKLPSSHHWGSFSANAWPARNCNTTNCAGIAVR